tara:strand:+ start:5794 stop:5955 length:162 start_codon:yes stop_codon:yes gene_type:complete
MAGYTGNHFVVTYEDNVNGKFTADVYAKDADDAEAKIKIAYPWALNLSATAGA